MELKHLGTNVLDVPPTSGNPRNSESAFIEMADGSIMLVYSRFIGDDHGDDANACLAARYSADSGETWSDDHVIARPEGEDVLNIMSVSLLRMQNGDIGLFYIIRKGWHDSRLQLRRSSDEGRTWSPAQCCIPALGYYVTNNDRVVRLHEGRLIVPCSLHRMRGESTTAWSSFDGRGIAFFFLSDDDGTTWREAQSFCVLPNPQTKTGLQEPGVVELENGVLWAWFRTDQGFQYESFSKDEGETWTPVTASIFTSPVSPLSMKRIPSTGDLLAVWNPIPNYLTRRTEKHSWGRTPLIAAISQDNGTSWGRFFAVEPEEDGGGYCYTAIHMTEDAVILAYCAGQEGDSICLTRLRVRKILLSEMYSI